MSTEVEYVETEEVPIEQVITLELQKQNVTEAVIAELKERYMPLTINGIEDREGYNAVKEARMHCKKIRVLAGKVCKKGREEAVAISKAWVTKEKEVSGQIEAVENHLQKMEDEFEAERDRLKAEEKLKFDRQGAARIAELTKLGATFDGTSFTLGDASFELSLIRESDDETYSEAILPRFQAIFDEKNVAAQAAEQERIAAEKKLADERAELERQQAEFKKQQEEMQRQKDEADKKEQKRLAEEKRIKEQAEEKLWRGRLQELTPIAWDSTRAFARHDNSIVATYEQLVSWTEDEFDAARQKHLADVMAYESEVEKKRQAEIAEREAAAAEEALKRERERVAEEKRQAQLKLEEEEAKRKEELEKAKDKEKWSDVVTYLSATPIHEMRNGIYRAKMKAVKDFLSGIK